MTRASLRRVAEPESAVGGRAPVADTSTCRRGFRMNGAHERQPRASHAPRGAHVPVYLIPCTSRRLPCKSWRRGPSGSRERSRRTGQREDTREDTREDRGQREDTPRHAEQASLPRCLDASGPCAGPSLEKTGRKAWTGRTSCMHMHARRLVHPAPADCATHALLRVKFLLLVCRTHTPGFDCNQGRITSRSSPEPG